MASISLHNQLSLPYSPCRRSSTHSPINFYPKIAKLLLFTIPPKPPQNPNTISTSGFPPLSKIPSCHLSSVPIPDSEPENHLKEATEAVREYLLQAGASSVEATYISTNCPNYLNMLIEGVRDIDDWNSSCASDERISIGWNWKKKVYQLAKQKDDNGVISYLESLGISLSSATYLARYLSFNSSSSLPELICKVRYVKELFFSPTEKAGDNGAIIGRNAGRMMTQLSISTDDDVQQTLAFFEKVQARRGGLNSLSSGDASFRHLIESFPQLLLLHLESHAKPLLHFFEEIGLPKERIRNIILLFPPILFYDVEKVIKLRLCSYENKIGPWDNNLSKMLAKYPWILSSSILENFGEIINFFNEEKVPKNCSSEAIKSWPHLLGCSVGKLKLMVEKMHEMGIKDKKLGHVIATSPQLLLSKPQEFEQIVDFFKELGLEDEAIAKTLGRCPEIFGVSIDKTLKRKLKFLSDAGISRNHFPRVIRKYPEVFVCDVDRTLVPRIKYLLEIGLSKYEIGSMVGRFSPLLGYSIEQVLRPKVEFLVKTMNKPLSEVVEYPRYFSYSLEKKIKPRFWRLKSRDMECNLKEMLSKNDDQFAEGCDFRSPLSS